MPGLLMSLPTFQTTTPIARGSFNGIRSWRIGTYEFFPRIPNYTSVSWTTVAGRTRYLLCSLGKSSECHLSLLKYCCLWPNNSTESLWLRSSTSGIVIEPSRFRSVKPPYLLSTDSTSHARKSLKSQTAALSWILHDLLAAFKYCKRMMITTRYFPPSFCLSSELWIFWPCDLARVLHHHRDALASSYVYISRN